MKSFFGIKNWSKSTKVWSTACVCVLLAAGLQIVIGVWFVLGLPFLMLTILLPVWCALYVYKSQALLWVVAGTLLAGAILFVEVNATSHLFGDICHDLSARYHNDTHFFGSDGQLICNYHNEDTIYAPAISSWIGHTAFVGIVLAATFNLLQVPFAIFYLIRRKFRIKPSR